MAWKTPKECRIVQRRCGGGGSEMAKRANLHKSLDPHEQCRKGPLTLHLRIRPELSQGRADRGATSQAMEPGCHGGVSL